MPALQSRDPIRPFLGFLTFAILYYVLLNIGLPVIRFLGGEMVAITVTSLLTASIANALALAIFESRPLTDIGLAWHAGAGHNLLAGIGLGAAAAAIVITGPVAAGMAHFQAVPNPDVSWRAILFMPVLLFCGAAGEELAFRGFSLQYLMRGYGNWAGILAIGVLFGILHGGNPNATPLGIVNTAGFGILFGFAVLRSHDLWLPIGMHFGWNAALPFLGTELSGLTIKVTGYELVWNAGDLWSGGKYGTEGSLFTSVVLIGLFTAVWKLGFRRGWMYLLDHEEPALEEPAQPQLP